MSNLPRLRDRSAGRVDAGRAPAAGSVCQGRLTGMNAWMQRM